MTSEPLPITPIEPERSAPGPRLVAPAVEALQVMTSLLQDDVDRQVALLREARLSGPLQLAGADLRQIDFPALKAAGLPGDILDGADLTRATLSGARLAGIGLRGARLDGALLVAVDLSFADLSSASLRGAHLTGANLSRSDLSFCDLRGASLLTADLSHVTATGVDLRETLLHSVRLSHAMLRGADLRWSRLDGANLVRTDLRGARFAGASLTLANLSGARLSASTDFGYAFLHRARFDRVALRREHLGEGIGEACAHLGQARDTYRALTRHFESEGRVQDARWAHRMACHMATRAHRPDRARRFFATDWQPRRPRTTTVLHPLGAPVGAAAAWAGRRTAGARATIRHGSLWALGNLNRVTTDFGTSYRRVLATLVTVWLAFGLFFQGMGGLQHVERAGLARWYDGLLFSATALTPIDAYPLVAAASAARVGALAEGVTGLVLFAALGYVSACRLRQR